MEAIIQIAGVYICFTTDVSLLKFEAHTGNLTGYDLGIFDLDADLTEVVAGPTHMFVDDLTLIVPPIVLTGLYATLTWFILDRRLNLE